MQAVLDFADSSFKYTLILFNLITFCFIYWHQRNRKTVKEHHVLFVTAHPDDEIMFFFPTISAIAKDYHTHILCLSHGATEREAELGEVTRSLGLFKSKCLHNEQMIDGQKQKWCEQTIREQVLAYVKEHNIRAIFTFDGEGVSHHENHKAVYRSLKELELVQPEEHLTAQQQQQQIKIYYLQSVNILRKYNKPLELLMGLLRTYSWINLNLLACWKAMSLHRSQFVWYRRLWLLFSSYPAVNYYKRARISLQAE